MASGNDRRDAPMFDPDYYGLSDRQAALCTEARRLGEDRFAGRADKWDRDAIFPMANYKDLHKAGLLAVCVPKRHGGHGADLKTYSLMAAEIGRYCGSTALTFNMHVSSCLWTGALADDLPMTRAQRREHNRAARSTTPGSSTRARSTPSRSPRAARRRPGSGRSARWPTG